MVKIRNDSRFATFHGFHMFMATIIGAAVIILPVFYPEYYFGVSAEVGILIASINWLINVLAFYGGGMFIVEKTYEYSVRFSGFHNLGVFFMTIILGGSVYLSTEGMIAINLSNAALFWLINVIILVDAVAIYPLTILKNHQHKGYDYPPVQPDLNQKKKWKFFRG